MKKIIIIALLSLFTSSIYSQTSNNEQGIIHYKVVDSTDRTKEDMKSIVETWTAKNLGDSNKAVKLANEDNVIVKTGVFMNYVGQKIFVNFILDVAFKDGQFKIEMYDFNYKYPYPGTNLEIYNPEYYTEEIYRKQMLANIETMSMGKNMALKKFNNPKKFKKYYDSELSLVTQKWNEIKPQIKTAGESLIKELKKTDDGW